MTNDPQEQPSAPDESTRETKIEGVSISSLSVRTESDAYSTKHIESVHIIDNPGRLREVLLWSGWLVFFLIIPPSNKSKEYFYYAAAFCCFVVILMTSLGTKHTYGVAVSVRGRKHVLSRFVGSTKDPEKLAAAHSRAEALAQAIRKVL